MAATATVVLTGLVYLAGLTPDQPQLMQAAVMKSETDRISTRGGPIPRHVAFIKVAKKFVDLDKTDRKEDIELSVRRADPLFVYVLDRESIKITGTNGGPANPKLVKVPTSGPVVSVDESVPVLPDFCPTCTLLTSTAFSNPNTRHVGGRVDFTVGRVFGRAISKCEKWSFDAEPGYPGVTQTKLAREVAVELDFGDDEQMMFMTAPLPGVKSAEVPPSTITFTKGPIEVLIGSATMEDIIGAMSAMRTTDRVDHHFELFYYLLEHSNRAGHPLLVRDPSCPGEEHRAGGVDCPPVQQ